MSARAISGTRRAFKELVDGTLRVTIDVDMESRRDFLRLFPDIEDGQGESALHWNDTPGRTKAEVLACIDNSIAALQ